MTIGPIQICIVGFRETAFRSEILAELNRLNNNDAVRIIDALGVVKTEDGDVRAITVTNSSHGQSTQMGPVMKALLGLEVERTMTNGPAPGVAAAANEQPACDGTQVFNLADELHTGEAAVIAVIEHRWMARIQDAVEHLNGTFLLDTYVNSDDLVGLGTQVARALEPGTTPV